MAGSRFSGNKNAFPGDEVQVIALKQQVCRPLTIKGRSRRSKWPARRPQWGTVFPRMFPENSIVSEGKIDYDKCLIIVDRMQIW